MKNLFLKSTLFLGVAVLSAQAQSITATIPFDFEANGKSMPAGEYKVMKSDSVNGGLFVMRGVDTHSSVLLNGHTPIANADGAVKLVFQRAGDGYYLTELWDGDQARTVASPKGRNSILAATKPVTRVAIAAHK